MTEAKEASLVLQVALAGEQNEHATLQTTMQEV